MALAARAGQLEARAACDWYSVLSSHVEELEPLFDSLPVVTEASDTVTPAPTVPVEEPKNEEKETSIAAGTEASAEGTTPVTSPEQTAPESPAAQDLVLECQAAGSVAQQSVQQFPVTCSK